MILHLVPIKNIIVKSFYNFSKWTFQAVQTDYGNILREAAKYYLTDFFFAKGLPPSPTLFSRNGKSFRQEKLSRKGGYPPPPLNGRSAKLFKRAKIYERGQKIKFLDPKYLLFSAIFLSRLGGYPPPLTENHFAKKNLVEMWVPPPFLTEKIRLVVFCSFP